jgi:Tfp pilus assembly protein PilF
MIKSLVFLLIVIFADLRFVFANEEQSCSKAINIMQQLSRRERIISKNYALSTSEITEQYEEALKLCTKIPAIYHNYGIFLDSQGRPEDARIQFEKALALEDRHDYRIAIAGTYLSGGHFTKAEEMYRAVHEKDPLDVKALQGLSIVAERTGQVDKAVELLGKAIDIEPSSVLSHFNLAALYERKEMYQEAMVHYARSLDVDPQYYPSLLAYGILLLKKSEVSSGIKLLEQAVRTPYAKDDARAHSALGAGYERQGNLEKAELSLRKALSFNESDGGSRANLALVLIRLNQPAQAIELLNEAPQNQDNINKDNESYAYLNNYARGLAEMRLGRYQEAEDFFRQALKIKPQDPLILGAMADLFEETGDTARAIQLRSDSQTQ